MFTWTSRAVLAVLFVSACQPVIDTLPSLPLLSSGEAITVYDGAVRISGPRHYCPDKSSLSETDSSAVVLLGRCSADSEAPPAILAVSVGGKGSAAVLAGEGQALAEFLTSESGRASLSRTKRAEDIEILSALMDDGVFLLQVEDKTQGRYWRGMVPVAGYLVSVSATGPSLPPKDGRDLVQSAARTLQRANRP